MSSNVESPGEQPLNAHGMTFNHLGLAVRNPRRAEQFVVSLGYELREPCHDPLQRVNARLAVHATMPDIEIIWPGEDDSPIDRILDRVDSGIYHSCYDTPSIASTLTSLEAAGIRHLVVAEPTPGIMFDNRLVAFVQVVGFGLLELIESAP